MFYLLLKTVLFLTSKAGIGLYLSLHSSTYSRINDVVVGIMCCLISNWLDSLWRGYSSEKFDCKNTYEICF
jgi:hypothetical protein